MGKELRGRVQGRRLGSGNINQSVGALFFSTSTKRCLFLLRKGDRYEKTWAFVGGKVETGEDLMSALAREIVEEIGFTPDIVRKIPIERFTNDRKGFEYNTYVAIVTNEFIPELNDEHSGYAWTTMDAWPKPLHPAVFGTLSTEEIVTKIKTITDLFCNTAETSSVNVG